MRRTRTTRLTVPQRDDARRAGLIDRVVRWDLDRVQREFDIFDDEPTNDQRPRRDLSLLRHLLAFGNVSGAAALIAVVAFLGDRVPVGWAAVSCVLYLVFAIVLLFGSRLPELAIRVISFDAVVLHLAATVALGDSLGYIGLIYAPWPALTVALFGTRADFTRLLVLTPVAFGVGLAVSDVPAPALAFGALTVVYGVCTFVIRGIAYRARLLFGEMDRVARTDHLTGLLNRGAATDALDRAIARAKRQNTDLALVVFDLDHFKRINDTLGHPAGDEALRRFSQVLLNTCSGTDVAARLGGEEFVVILLRSDESGGRAFAERFSEALDYETARDPAPLSVSAGVAALGDELHNSERLLVAADRALYAAKRAGRHQVVAASDPGVGPLGSPLP